MQLNGIVFKSKEFHLADLAEDNTVHILGLAFPIHFQHRTKTFQLLSCQIKNIRGTIPSLQESRPDMLPHETIPVVNIQHLALILQTVNVFFTAPRLGGFFLSLGVHVLFVHLGHGLGLRLILLDQCLGRTLFGSSLHFKLFIITSIWRKIIQPTSLEYSPPFLTFSFIPVQSMICMDKI